MADRSDTRATLNSGGRLFGVVLGSRYRKSSVRWRLTLLYAGLFLASGVMLLALTYLLVAHAAIAPNLTPKTLSPVFRQLLNSPNGQTVSRLLRSNQRVADLHHLILESAIAVTLMGVVSALLGWLMAGRFLRPLRTITATTSEISATNLHERLEPRRPRRRAQGARGHLRRAARPTRALVCVRAPVRRQRLSRAAHAARGDADVARRGDGQTRPACPAHPHARRPAAPRARPRRPAAGELPHPRPRPAGAARRRVDGLARRTRSPGAIERPRRPIAAMELEVTQQPAPDARSPAARRCSPAWSRT